MFKKYLKLFSAAVLVSLFSVANETNAQNAKIQIVHNAPLAPAVDIFAGATKLVPNLAFRSATAFTEVPSGVPIQVRLKVASASNDTSNPVFFRTYTLEAGKSYYLVANGNIALPGTSYAANPGGINTNFDITVLTDAKETAAEAGNVELRIMHSVTDAPAVDIRVQGLPDPIVPNAAFRQFSGYIPVPAANYTVQIALPGSNDALLAYKAPLTGFAGSTVFVLASGYLNPANNTANGTPGPAFGLLAVTPGGSTILLPTAVSRAQIIHNTPSAPAVDVYVNNILTVPALAFRRATPFVDLPAGVPITVALRVAGSEPNSAPAFSKGYTLDGDAGYHIIANGLLSTDGFAVNPDGISRNFDLDVLTGAREASSTAASDNNAEFRVFHGSPDAPTVDVRVSNGGPTLVDNAPFRAGTPYLNVDAIDYNLDITTSDGSVIVATYTAPLSAFADSAILVMASGFLSPANNQVGGQNGPAFGLFAVTAKGQVVALPITSIRERIIADQNLVVSPNPTTNELRINWLDRNRASQAYITDITGKKIMEVQNIQNGSLLYVNSLKKGIYFLNLVTTEGYQVSRKFIKE